LLSEIQSDSTYPGNNIGFRAGNAMQQLLMLSLMLLIFHSFIQ